VRGATHIPLGHLADRLDEVPRDRPLVVHCQTGNRSAIAVSVLQQHGFDNAMNLTGGYVAWHRAGGAVEKGMETAAA
jgi:rhodanese-related sulfurtransferase